MNILFIQVMKGFSLLILALFAAGMLSGLRKEKKKAADRRGLALCLLALLLHLFGFLTLLVSDLPEKRYLYLYLPQLGLMLGLMACYAVFYRGTDWLLMAGTLLLSGQGMVFVARLKFAKAEKLLLFFALSLFAALLVPLCLKTYAASKKIVMTVGIGGLVLLGMVLVLGRTVYGANLSLSIPGTSFSIQPSELVKVSFVLMMAYLLSGSQSLKRIVMTALLALLHVAILVLSKDLGGALIFAVTYIGILYVATGKLVCLIGGLGLGALGSVLAYALFDHVKVRVMAWLDPWSVIERQGYQICQSLFSLVSGGFFGTGLGLGSPLSIPAVEKDFIFSAIAEEMGAIFALLLLAVCLFVLIRMIQIAAMTDVFFYKLTGCGMAVLYGTQIILTVGGDIRFIPSTGVTLPFVSYGGSSLLGSFLIFGVLQTISVKSSMVKKAEKLEEKLSARAKKPSRRQKKILAGNDVKNAGKRTENREGWRLATGFSGLFVLMAVSLCVTLVFTDEGILKNPYNKSRIKKQEDQIARGSILSSDGAVLASTTEEGERFYPYYRLFAHSVGYTGTVSSGIEQMFAAELSTCSLPTRSRLNYQMADKKLPGDNVISSLDAAMQFTAYTALGDRKGAVIAMEADTGRILVEVSKPDFDPNAMETVWEHIAEISENESFLVNRATNGLYPAGSTFKLMTSLMYMRSGREVGAFRYDCTGSFTLGDVTMACSEGHVHGLVGLRQAIEQSCNGAFAKIGSELSNEDFLSLADGMFFNRPLPISLPHKASSLPVTEKTNEYDRMNMAIGQGKMLISPLHETLITAAIANGGVMMAPRLVDSIVSAEGQTVYQSGKQVIGEVLTEEEADLLAYYMRQTVKEGTAYLAAGEGYTAAGKTGSAQFSSSTKKLHAWFTGFAYGEDGKKIVVTVLIEGGGYGGLEAAPIAKKLWDVWFSRQGA